MEAKRSQALEALEISAFEVGKPQYVNCQRCGQAVALPTVGLLNSSLLNRIKHKQVQLHRIEEYPYGNGDSKEADLNAIRQEIAELQQQLKREKLYLPVS